MEGLTKDLNLTLQPGHIAKHTEMKYDKCHLPNGQQVTVAPVFGGFKFKPEGQDLYGSFPPEWTIIIWTETGDCDSPRSEDDRSEEDRFLPFKKPSLENDCLYLSSVSVPSVKDLKPSSAPTRQVAMVLWVTFLWYFQEEEPNHHVETPGSPEIPESGRITKDWKIKIQQKGILSGRNQMMKLERLGIIASEDASVGEQGASSSFDEMFITQNTFWQLDPRIYLVTLSSVESAPGSVYPEPGSSMDSLGTGFPFGAGPNTFGTFLPSYYPSRPLQYKFTENIRHPVRSKSYRQGEVFYTRYVPSGGQYLTLRVPVLPTKGPLRPRSSASERSSGETGPDLCLDSEQTNDLKLIHQWIQDRPADTALSRKGPITSQADFLEEQLSSQNSFPALAFWDSIPIGYFELFWVQEDYIGPSLGDAGDWDRGVRCFLGNADFQKPESLAICLSSLINHCWLYDQRTNTVIFDVRADNKDFISSLECIGCLKDREVNIPRERSVIMKIRRDSWVAPVV